MGKKVITVALQEIGYLEKETNAQLDSKTGNAGDENYTKYARDLYSIPGFYNGNKNGYAWCDVFVDWCFVEAYGVDKAKKMINHGQLGAGVNYSAQYYKNAKRWYTSPKIGDQIFFRTSKYEYAHTGLVVDITTTHVITVEGNTKSGTTVIENGGEVCKKSYKLSSSSIVGYGRPDYALVGEDGNDDCVEPLIYLSPSDQTKNTYSYGGTNEDAQCTRIANAAEVALKRCGFNVVNNTDDSMEERISESNKLGASLHIPIHTNAFNESVSGTRIFCYNLSGEGYKAAKAIFDVLAPITPGTSENIKANTTLSEIKKTNCPCVYIEVDFHDVSSVAKWIIENTELIGETIAKGVCNYYKKKYVKPVKVVEPSNVLYRVQVGAFSVRANAEAYKNKLKADGYDAFIVEEKK